MSALYPTDPKLFSNVEISDEVDADERLKGKEASRRDTQAAKRSSSRKKKKPTTKPQPEDDGNTRKRGRPRKDAAETSKAKKKGRPRKDGGGGGTTTKKSIKRVREQRRIQQSKDAKKAEEEEARKRARKAELDLDYHPGNIIAEAQDVSGGAAAAPEDFFWEVEAVIGRRIRRGRAEYLIRWKGCSEDDNTWEPAANLCDTAMEEATKYTKALKAKEKQREEDEKMLFDSPDDDTAVDGKKDEVVVIDDAPKAENVAPTKSNDSAVDIDSKEDSVDVVDDTRWKWSDADQVEFRNVERIDVNDPNAAKIVKEARINGTPLVLVGHVGWANFAKRWLSKKKKAKAEKMAVKEAKSESKIEGEGETKPASLDLSTTEQTDSGSKDVDGGMITDNPKPGSVAERALKALEESPGSDTSVDEGGDIAASPTVDSNTADLSGNEPSDSTNKASTTKYVDLTSQQDKASTTECVDLTSVTTSGRNTPVPAPPMEGGQTNGVSDTALKPLEVDTNTTNKDSAVDPPTAAAFDEKAASKVSKEEPSKEEAKTSSNTSNDLVDLSDTNYELDLKKMIKDIGQEDVPVIKRNYNEEKPIHGRIAAEKFLTNCWPTSDPAPPEQEEKTTKKNASNLYLHQWQFPLSDTAGRKLCHQSNPLPKGIMGEDLLKYWLDLPQCKLDSPLQYIFMGREDTLSKLHKDPGGLEISIAPIVGQKECVLVHRADGSNCLYHLNASLENVDLQRYPLLTQARAWRTVIEPGEILLMPYGTYHQCRNLTPCLSYSRFHLDTVNLLPFVQSLINGDAPEIDHEEVMWNLTSELIKRLDSVFDQVQTRVKAGMDEGNLITEDVIDTVNTLRTLRHFMREVARREEIRQVVKGDTEAIKSPDEHNFAMLVDDVDMCLHEFRYRQSRVVPPFKTRKGKALKNTLSGASGGRKDVIKRDVSKHAGVVAFNTSLENNYMSLVNAEVSKRFPNAAKDKVGEKLIGDLVPGDKLFVQLVKRFVKSEVVEILPQMKAAYLSFEDYPSIYDEYQPYELLRLPNGAEIPPEDIKPGLTVIDLSNSNEYRAKIQSIVNGPMARVKLTVSQHEMTRLVSPAMILGRYVPPQRKSKKSNLPAGTALVEVVEPTIVRPSKVGDIVEVALDKSGLSRGSAKVINIHGDPATHVDVRFILGSATTENMIPIENVKLAPELDPQSGRGRRNTASKSKDNQPADENGSKPIAGMVSSPSTTASMET